MGPKSCGQFGQIMIHVAALDSRQLRFPIMRSDGAKTVVSAAARRINGASDAAGAVRMSDLRIPGVLQRLAASYAVVALLHVPFAKAHVPVTNVSRALPSFTDDR